MDLSAPSSHFPSVPDLTDVVTDQLGVKAILLSSSSSAQLASRTESSLGWIPAEGQPVGSAPLTQVGSKLLIEL